MNIKPKIRTTRVELRLAPNQKKALQRKADELKISMSQLIVNVLQLPDALDADGEDPTLLF